MGRIQSSIGVITGIPIMDTVDSLMQLAARPRELLINRNTRLQAEQLAINGLAASLLSVKYIIANLGKAGIFGQRKVTSSDSDKLSATSSGQPPLGSYQFTPLRMVQSQQFVSSGFADDSSSIGVRAMTIRYGAHVQRSASLELFGSGQGVDRGKIRITDRSGAQAVVDLSAVQTVDDVLQAINDNTSINVTAVAHGDNIRLVDDTGQTASNLKVEEFGGTTAASLGLAGIDVADDVIDGQDMLWLHRDIDLDELNDGNGVRIDSVLADIGWTLRDGTSSNDEGYEPIDFSPIISGSSNVDEDRTLGDILDAINAAAPGKLKAEIDDDGHGIKITDLTQGDGAFQLSSTYDSEALADLGLDGAAVDGVITGRRLLAGAKTVLLSSLNGGQGLGPLGVMQLTNRLGITNTVDLSAAETLEDVINAINDAGMGFVAQVNEAKNGIELLDTTGASGDLTICNSVTAEKLGLVVNDSVERINSGDLHLQVISENTLLSQLNGGAGVASGSFVIHDSHGEQGSLTLSRSGTKTIGDVIRKINSLGLDLHAEINETGDGIRIVDSPFGDSGPFELKIEDGATGSAAGLYLTGDAEEVDIDGEIRSVINGRTTRTVSLDVPFTRDTLLDDLNGKQGVALGSIVFTDSTGQTESLDLDPAGGAYQTAGDVIDGINQLGLTIHAEINETNNGLLIVDTGDGDATLTIKEGNSTTASDLHLLGAAVDGVDDEDNPTQVIDGAHGVHSLRDLRDAINDLDAGVTAMIFNDGSSSKPYRLSLTSDRAGKVSQLVIDTSQLGFSLQETGRAADALLVFGDSLNPAANILVSSGSNTFRDIVPDIAMTIGQPSDTPVTITVGTTDTDLIASVQVMVDNYNNFRDSLAEATKYDTVTNVGSVLTGDAAALRLDADLSYFFSGRFAAVGPIKSLAEVGVGFNGDGTLTFDQAKLKARYAADPEAVEQFFTDEEFGVSAKFGKLVDSLTAENSSLLTNRDKTLQSNIERNQERIDLITARLDMQREILLRQFYQMEMAIARMQSGLSALDGIKALPPVTSVRK